MNLLVIGSSVEDFLHQGDKVTAKPGGIFYTISALHYYKDENDILHLCTSISYEKIPIFSPVYSELDKTHFHFTDKIPDVHLFLHEKKERDECYGHIAKEIIFNIDNYSFYDGILINMITGFDITLEQLMDIRKNYSGLIYFDVHTLARGLNDKGERHFRIIPQKEKWLSFVNIVQVNESELKTLSTKEIELDIAKEILHYVPSILIVTKGKRGARVYTKEKEEIISVFHSSTCNAV